MVLTVILATTGSSAGTGAGGFLLITLARVLYGRTRRGRLAAEQRRLHRQEHPPSAEIAHRWIASRTSRHR